MCCYKQLGALRFDLIIKVRWSLNSVYEYTLVRAIQNEFSCMDAQTFKSTYLEMIHIIDEHTFKGKKEISFLLQYSFK